MHPSNWFTSVWIHNPGSEVATARIYLLERGTANLSPPWVDVPIEAGDTELIDNIVETLFHREVFGALRVTCGTQSLVVSSRVYSRAVGAGARDSVGQDFAGVPASFAIGLGERTTILGVHQTQPPESSDFRYNFGFVETTGHNATVRVRSFDRNNADQGFVDLQVREWSQRQVAFRDHFPGVSTENSRLEVEVIAGTGRVIAYGSGIANGSQDPTTFEATALLAQPTGIPSGAVMMFDLQQCPVGWTELVAARGRAVVGLPLGGSGAGTVGTALGDLENRQHTHMVDPESVPTATAGDHSHSVGPIDVLTTSVAAHSHTVDVPRTESFGAPAHNHTTAATPFDTYSAGGHSHKWSTFTLTGPAADWSSYDVNGDLDLIISSGNGMDMSGIGTYPIALPNPLVNEIYYTSRSLNHWHSATVPQTTTALAGPHAHDVDPAAFASSSAGAHNHNLHIGEAGSTTAASHSHNINLPPTESAAAATSAVMPYIQLLACRKD